MKRTYRFYCVKVAQVLLLSAYGLVDDARNSEVLIPRNIILGFPSDYQKIIRNAKHELILTRSDNDTNAMQQPPAAQTAQETFNFSY